MEGIWFVYSDRQMIISYDAFKRNCAESSLVRSLTSGLKFYYTYTYIRSQCMIWSAILTDNPEKLEKIEKPRSRLNFDWQSL